MSKIVLLLLLSVVATVGNATPLYVSSSGQFAATDVNGTLVAPGGTFTVMFAVDDRPMPVAGSVSGLGFDVPIVGFSYMLNGTRLNATPSEIRFNTLANGGLFDITFGSGLSAAIFSFQGAQAFTGTTAAPSFSLGTLSLTAFTYSDASNFDAQSPVGRTVSITPTPEPISLLSLCLGMSSLIGLRSRRLFRSRQ